jgi:chromosome segregation ATPase
MKNYGSTLSVAEKLRASLPAESTQDEAGEAVAREQLAFLGRICGYLAGPVADNVDQVARKQLEKTILTGLNEDRKLIFEQARDSVSQKFFELTDTKLDTEKKNVEVRKEEAEQTLQDVEAARKEIEDRAKELEERGTKLQKELSDELAQIAKLDAPLAAELARLQTQADIISRDLVNFQIQIDRLNVQLARERDPNLRNLIRRDIDTVSFQASRVSGQLDAVQRQGQNVQAQRAALVARAQQAQGNFGGQLDRINKELVALGKREKRADYEEKKAKKPVSGSSTKTIALSSQVTSLSTYDKFPLEQAKERLLSELK